MNPGVELGGMYTTIQKSDYLILEVIPVKVHNSGTKYTNSDSSPSILKDFFFFETNIG